MPFRLRHARCGPRTHLRARLLAGCRRGSRRRHVRSQRRHLRGLRLVPHRGTRRVHLVRGGGGAISGCRPPNPLPALLSTRPSTARVQRAERGRRLAEHRRRQRRQQQRRGRRGRRGLFAPPLPARAPAQARAPAPPRQPPGPPQAAPPPREPPSPPPPPPPPLHTRLCAPLPARPPEPPRPRSDAAPPAVGACAEGRAPASSLCRAAARTRSEAPRRSDACGARHETRCHKAACRLERPQLRTKPRGRPATCSCAQSPFSTSSWRACATCASSSAARSLRASSAPAPPERRASCDCRRQAAAR